MPDSEHLDASQFEALYVRLERPLYNVVYRWLWNRDDAIDVVQEAFVRLWNKRETLRAETAQAYAYRTALNLAANRRRARRLWRWTGLEDAPQQHSNESDAQSREREAAVQRAVEALPEKQKRVVMLAEFSEMSYAQIAEVLGVPEGTVASRRNTAMKSLEATLGGLRGDA